MREPNRAAQRFRGVCEWVLSADLDEFTYARRFRAGGGAKGRLPTGVFFETRRGSLAETTRAGAPSPSTRTRDATPVSVRT